VPADPNRGVAHLTADRRQHSTASFQARVCRFAVRRDMAIVSSLTGGVLVRRLTPSGSQPIR